MQNGNGLCRMGTGLHGMGTGLHGMGAYTVNSVYSGKRIVLGIYNFIDVAHNKKFDSYSSTQFKRPD